MKNIRIIVLAALQLTVISCLSQAPIVGNGAGPGNCLSFNGTSNYVSINTRVMPIGAKTVSVWFKTTLSGSGQGEIYDDCNVFSNNNGTTLDIRNNGQLFFASRQGNGSDRFNFTIPGPYNDGKWHNAVASWDGTTNANGVKLYVDGALAGVATSSSTETVLSTYNSVIGDAANHSYATTQFLGQLDEIRIWNRALNQNEIRDIMCKKLKGNEAGLVGYWRLDEGTGTTTADATVNSNTGTLH